MSYYYPKSEMAGITGSVRFYDGLVEVVFGGSVRFYDGLVEVVFGGSYSYREKLARWFAADVVALDLLSATILDRWPDPRIDPDALAWSNARLARMRTPMAEVMAKDLDRVPVMRADSRNLSDLALLVARMEER